MESPDQWNNPRPVGSGPFQLIHHRRGEEILLQANEDHFNAPQVDEVLIVNHASTDAVFSSLMDGSVDMPDRSIDALNIPDAEEAPHLGLVDVRDFGVFYMGFNFRRPPFNDLAVRQAIAHTLDHETVVEAVLGGFGEPGQGMIAPANAFWHNPEWETWLNEDYNFSVPTARQILDEAGYRWDAEGNIYYPPGGPPNPAE
jgi:peptide/nickel transport system substrate-binding protein